MSTKFEKLLDYIVNEEMDKANELFHEIVVEKSREIYENLIVQEVDEETTDTDDEEQQDESMESDEETEEPLQYEDSYELEADDDDTMDKTDDLETDIEADQENPADDELGEPDSEEEAIDNIDSVINDLEAAFAELKSLKGMDSSSSFDDEDEDKEMDMMGLREYREKVGKHSGFDAGAGTGEKMSAPNEGVSPISKGSGKPTSAAKAIHTKSADTNEDGTKPHGKVGGLVKQGGKFTGNNTHNVEGQTSGVKTLSKVTKPSQGEGHAAGSGSGDNSVKGSTNTKSLI